MIPSGETRTLAFTLTTRRTRTALTALMGTGLMGAAFTMGCSSTVADSAATASGSSAAGPAATVSAAISAAASASASAPIAQPAASADAPPLPPELPELEKKLRGELPKGSGDYAHALALATLFADKAITYETLEAAVLAMKLPPHPSGDAYLLVLPPPPPPGTPFVPKSMPTDWQGTWGEVAEAMLVGKLDKPTYTRLHRAAHPDCP